MQIFSMRRTPSNKTEVRRSKMNIEPILPSQATMKKIWISPAIQVLDINQALGATAGPLCDKHGSLSATQGNDSCTTNPKP
jgi:hypothetical protein